MYADADIYSNEILTLKIDDKTVFKLRKPSVKMFIKMQIFKSGKQTAAESAAELARDILNTNISHFKVDARYMNKLPYKMILLIIAGYDTFICKLLNNNKYVIPSKPCEKKETSADFMQPVKVVCDYARMSYTGVLNMNVDLFFYALKSAVVSGLKETEEGRKYLADCERLTKKNTDITGLMRVFGGAIKNAD